MGLKISAQLSVADPEYDGLTDAAIIKIGDSTIKLPCNSSGVLSSGDDLKPNLKLSLIKGNRTKITKSSIKGINIGYDVFGGGATDLTDGTSQNGYSGGFVGYNKEGVFSENEMIYCDEIRGTANENNLMVGAFAGTTTLDSVYSFNTVDTIEKGNKYSVYRVQKPEMKLAWKGSDRISTMVSDTETGINYNRFVVTHYEIIKTFGEWKNAVMSTEDMSETANINVYVSPAKAVLMMNTPVENNPDSLLPEPEDVVDPCLKTTELTIQKVWDDKGDFDKIRPDKIHVTITQSHDENGITVIDSSWQEELTADEHGSIWTATWRKVIKDLPVAFRDDNDEVVYYKYTVTEENVPEYESKVEYLDGGYAVKITNIHIPVLPATGGKGSRQIYFMDIILVMIGAEFILHEFENKKRHIYNRRI